MKLRLLPAGLLLLLALCNFSGRPAATAWKTLRPAQEPAPRGENAFVRVGSKFYLFGGRKKQSVDVYDPRANAWTDAAPVPVEMHHFQAVAHGGEIYVAGAFTGDYPHETPLPRLYIYNPAKNAWREGAEIPANRRRGSGGVVVYRDKLYLVCGITDGHYDGHVAWLDEFDPATGKWRTLPDAPRARDHFQAAVVGDKLVVTAGRRSTGRTGHVADLTVAETDVFDFRKGAWQTLPAAGDIPTPRASCTAVTLGNRVLVIGGESTQKAAHNQTEAFDVKSGTWETLPPLQTGRHGTQAVGTGNKIYIAAGIGNAGGGPELSSLEVLE